MGIEPDNKEENYRSIFAPGIYTSYNEQINKAILQFHKDRMAGKVGPGYERHLQLEPDRGEATVTKEIKVPLYKNTFWRRIKYWVLMQWRKINERINSNGTRD